MTNEELLEKIIDAVEVKRNSVVLLQVPMSETEALSQSLMMLRDHIGSEFGIEFLVAPDNIKITVIPPGKSKIELSEK